MFTVIKTLGILDVFFFYLRVFKIKRICTQEYFKKDTLFEINSVPNSF